MSELPEVMQDALGAFARVTWGDVRYPWTLPITSAYGPRTHPVTGEIGSFHTGVDFGIAVGTPLIAVWNGDVTRVDVDGVGKGEINGNAVFIRCGVFTFAYLHMSRVDVRPGDRLLQGAQLGLSGATGRVTGPHLHFQASIGAAVFDPMLLFPSWRE